MFSNKEKSLDNYIENPLPKSEFIRAFLIRGGTEKQRKKKADQLRKKINEEIGECYVVRENAHELALAIFLSYKLRFSGYMHRNRHRYKNACDESYDKIADAYSDKQLIEENKWFGKITLKEIKKLAGKAQLGDGSRFKVFKNIDQPGIINLDPMIAQETKYKAEKELAKKINRQNYEARIKMINESIGKLIGNQNCKFEYNLFLKHSINFKEESLENLKVYESKLSSIGLSVKIKIEKKPFWSGSEEVYSRIILNDSLQKIDDKLFMHFARSENENYLKPMKGR